MSKIVSEKGSILFQIIPQLKTILLKALCFALAIEALKIVPYYLLKDLVDELVLPNPSSSFLIYGVLGILAISLLVTLIEVNFFSFSSASAFSVEASILQRCHQKLLSLGLRFHETNPSGEIVHLLNKGGSRLLDLTWFMLDQFLGASIQIVLTCIVLIWIHPACGAFFLLFMPIVIYLVHQSSMQVQPLRKHYHAKHSEATWSMNQSILNIRTVKDFTREQFEHRRFSHMIGEYLDLANTRMRAENSHILWRDIVLGFARFGVLGYAVYLVTQGAMTPGTLFLFATLSEKVVASLYRLGRLYSYLGDSIESIQQFSDLLNEEPHVQDKETALPCDTLSGHIEITNLSFSYQIDMPVIQNISLDIPAKHMVALVGRSGSGKSSLAKLLCRHYDPTLGCIRVDGVDIRDYRLHEYRRHLAVVSQHVEIFDCSVAENIAYGLDVDFQEIERAAGLAHALDFINDLPDGFHTQVGEKGVRLSGGQQQRIGIARALLIKPAILIFDEATSSLDTESEQLIQQAMLSIFKKQTMIVIAHRLSTILHADTIVVLDHGKVVESGSYQELMRKEGAFARMRELQNLGDLRE